MKIFPLDNPGFCIRIKHSAGGTDFYAIILASNLFIFKEETIMAYVINDTCVCCGACEGECPVGAISQGEGKFEIDSSACIDCGACAGSCPTGAIEQE